MGRYVHDDLEPTDQRILETYDEHPEVGPEYIADVCECDPERVSETVTEYHEGGFGEY